MIVEQPHFDDERTVLRARRVVPLEAIDSKLKHRRLWFLGGAFVVAMILGAASALVSAYIKFRSVPDPEIQSLSVLSVPEETPPTPVVEVVSQRPKPKPRNTEQTDRSITEPAPAIQPGLSEKEALRQIRDAVLIEQWQERRARRVERPERRRAQHHDRDLSNINEIFEGPRHP
jgi:hypothetical protein